MSKNYINQGSLSNKLGWSEATGRKWITEFQEFLPPKIEGNKKMYDESAYQVFTVTIKKLSDKKLTRSQILDVFRVNGVPSAPILEIDKIVKEYSFLSRV